MTDEQAPSTSPDDPFGLEALWRLMEREPDGPAADPLVGTTIGDVEIVRMIAEGGMGRVYEGVQASPRRPVAVKVLRPGPTARAAIRRFLNEAQILGTLRHPWICQVHAAGTFEVAGVQLPYFVMELISEGLPITDYVRRHKLPLASRIALFGQVCDALAHAHAHGVIHRDLKPGNILVDAAGHPKVIDFGIARGDMTAIDLAELTMTGTGQLLGTIQYMSPEQVDGDSSAVDRRTDVYALGMMLHELVADSTPYHLDGVPLLEAVRIIRECRPPRLCDGVAGSPGLALVVDTCLQKDRSRRYADAAELIADLRRWLQPGHTQIGARARLLIRGITGRSSQRRLIAAGMAAAALLTLFAISRQDRADSGHGFGVLNAGSGGQSLSALPLLRDATLPFRHSFTSVLDAEADRYVVELDNVAKWNDPREELRVTYWGPTANDIEGRLVLCFRFPGRTARIHIDTESACWDFEKHHGGFGRGASAVQASRDGVTWITLRDNIAPRNWGASWSLKEDLPDGLLGTTELWLRLRFLTERAEPKAGYTVAQFARAVTGAGKTVFALEADCVPAE